MHTLTILLANPLAHIREAQGTLLVHTGPGNATHTGETSSEGIAIRVRRETSGPFRVEVERGLTTGDEIYYYMHSGHLIISDHFAGALSQVPLERRDVPDDSIADHLLFRTTPGTSTYVRGIHRLGHGERLEWVAGSDRPRRSETARLRPTRLRRTVEEQLAGVEAALGQALAVPGAGDDDLVNLLSGGIDSTLIQTFLGSGIPSTSAAIDSPEFAMEVGYALAASRFTGTRHELIDVSEAEYAERLESCIQALGLPPQHLQTVLLDAVYRESPHRSFITGQLADALFGLEPSLLGRRAWMFRHFLRLPGFPAAAGLLAPLGRRVDSWAAAERQLTLPPEHPGGYAMMHAVYSDVPTVRDMLGERLVQERMEARLRYVRARVELVEERPGLESHLSLGHWIDFYCDDTVSLWRQLAHGRGRALIAPFTHSKVARSALEVPASGRYIRRGVVKHLLKSLLRQRLPAYPVDQPKGGSGLPFLRYAAKGGPIRQLLEDYPLPGFVDSALRRTLLETPTWITWNVVAYAVWSERVLRRPTLEGVPQMRRFVLHAEGDFGGAAAPPSPVQTSLPPTRPSDA